MHRDGPTAQAAEYMQRAGVLSSINEEDGSIGATIASETRATVLDRQSWRVIDEILIARGGTFPEEMPLLDNHAMYSSFSVFGHAEQFKRSGDAWQSRVFFDIDDEEGGKLWRKVKNRHVRNVSIGYTVQEGTEIEVGQAAVVAGRRFVNDGVRVLRVATKWTAHELSVVPNGADSSAKFRTGAGVVYMNKRLKKYLVSLGMDANADDVMARSFLAGLTGVSATIAKLLDYPDDDQQQRTNVDVAIRSLGFDPENPAVVRSDSQAVETNTVEAGQAQNSGQQRTNVVTHESALPATAGGDGAAAFTRSSAGQVAEGRRLERERQEAIRALAGPDVSETTIRQAIDEDWSVQRASQVVLDEIRRRRQQHATTSEPGGATAGGPAIHTRSRETDLTSETLAGILYMRRGVDPVADAISLRDGVPYRVNPGSRNDELERSAENANRFADMPMVDVVREALRLDGIEPPRGGAAALGAFLRRSAVPSSSTLNGIFTQSFSAELLMAYESTDDTSVAFTVEKDVPNYRTNERHRMTKGQAMKRHARGGTAENFSYADASETYKIHAYSGMFTFDEQDMVDDTFGAVNDHAPNEMGEAAREIRPDLVYGIMLSNPAMRDAVALFHASHGNYSNSLALSPAALETALTAFNTQRENGRNISKSRGVVLVTSEKLAWLAERIVTSESRGDSTSDGVGVKNVFRNKRISLVSDARIDNGVVDPLTETTIAGNADVWFLARPNSRHTIEVGYLQGTQRSPDIRPYTLDKGQWGIGWDVKLSVGAKALDWLGLSRYQPA